MSEVNLIKKKTIRSNISGDQILVIVESPSKTKTIGKYLGSKYKVIATRGHVRKLVKKRSSVQLGSSGPEFVWEEEKEKIKPIIASIKGCSSIILATDLDREGEAIAWHVTEILKNRKIELPYKRVSFNTITQESILFAFQNLKDLNIKLIHAYLTRVAIDFIFGFTLSPLLWKLLKPFRYNQSSGRVQSTTLRLVMEKHKERQKFKKEKYYSIIGFFNENYTCKLVKWEGIKISSDITSMNAMSSKRAEEIMETMKTQSLKYKLHKSTQKVTKISPRAPLITSTLQQQASRLLNIRVNQVMKIAQGLYEKGYITYHRTDSTFLNPHFTKTLRSYIKTNYSEYLSIKENKFGKKIENAQEAHECIRPTRIQQQKIDLKEEYQQVYDLIRFRTMESQMKPVQRTENTYFMNHEVHDHQFKYTDSYISFVSFYIFYPSKLINNTWNKKNQINFTKREKHDHETRPPALYTEASLVKKLESLGIGRPSTYAHIFETLNNRKYINYKKRSIDVTFRGFLTSIFQVKYFHECISYDFTAEMERLLENILKGLDYLKALQKKIEVISKIEKELLVREKKEICHGIEDEILLDRSCTECKFPLKILDYDYQFFSTCSSCNSRNNLDESVVQLVNNTKLIHTEKYSYISHGDQRIYVPHHYSLDLSSEDISYLARMPIITNFEGLDYKFSKTSRNFFICDIKHNKYLNFRSLNNMKSLTMQEIKDKMSQLQPSKYKPKISKTKKTSVLKKK